MPAAYSLMHFAKNSLRPSSDRDKRCDPTLRTCWDCESDDDKNLTKLKYCAHDYHEACYSGTCELCDEAVSTGYHYIAKSFNDNHEAAVVKQLNADNAAWRQQEGIEEEDGATSGASDPHPLLDEGDDAVIVEGIELDYHQMDVQAVGAALQATMAQWTGDSSWNMYQ